MLRVLDSPPPVAIGVVCIRGFEEIERLPIPSISDCMHAELKVVLDGEPGRLGQLFKGNGRETGAVSEILVGLQQPRAVCAKRAIDCLLDRSDREEPVARAHGTNVGQGFREVLVAVSHHDPQPQAQAALLRQRLQHHDLF